MARPGGGSDDGWFRLWTIEVTTTVLVLVLAIASIIERAIEASGGPLQTHILLDPDSVVSGQVWRVATWPIAYPNGIGLLDVFTLFILWYFGTEIESLLGKKKMAWFLALITVGLGLLWVAVVELSTSYGQLFTLNQIELMVLLVFIAEYPHRRFFFNIPGWVIGVIIVGISVLSYVGSREWLLLLNFGLGLALTALIARSMGLMSEWEHVPRISFRRSRAPKRSKSPKRPKRASGGPTVVQGPWQPTPTPPVSRDQAALDALLDKISASGMDSLTDGEREQLMILRDRLRRR
jgi:uncharacterized protein DUF6576